ncbi:MAG: hypothetical protein Q9160_008240 [Pyrenula sp. 1 TL-2023]
MSAPSSYPNPNQTPETESEPPTDPSMKPTPDRALTLLSAHASILSRIRSSIPTSPSPPSSPPRLVLVSKLKPASDILALHRPDPSLLQQSQSPSLPKDLDSPPPALHFGENYLQELLQKSHLLPPTIKWHFIGGLQSNKCVQLARDVRGLWAVESVDSVKKAQGLEKGWGERMRRRKEAKTNNEDGEEGAEEGEEEEKLRVFVQVNTSGEESKSGVPPDLPASSSDSSSSSANGTSTSTSSASSDFPLLTLTTHILQSCPHLHLQGLMTIGAIARSTQPSTSTSTSTSPSNPSTPSPNEDFTLLSTTRSRLAPLLNLAEADLELSMGMSSDFETAISQGSGEVRVGSTVFGERPMRGEARVLESTAGEKGA